MSVTYPLVFRAAGVTAGFQRSGLADLGRDRIARGPEQVCIDAEYTT